MKTPEDLQLDSALRAARAAGALIRNRFGSDFRVDYKTAVDPVTEVDRECERLIREILDQEHPGIAFWGEEFGTTDENADLTWIADPLDGTKNFVHGYPNVAVSIALVDGSTPLLGVVYDPLRNEMFTALRGQGAFLDGKPITVSNTETLSRALVVTSLNCYPPEQLELIIRVCTECQGVRRGGAAALDLVQVAAGRLDIVWEWNLRPWDMAAAWLIIEEAQGTVTGLKGTPFDLYGGGILATNSRLHKQATDLLSV